MCCSPGKMMIDSIVFVNIFHKRRAIGASNVSTLQDLRQRSKHKITFTLRQGLVQSGRGMAESPVVIMLTICQQEQKTKIITYLKNLTVFYISHHLHFASQLIKISDFNFHKQYIPLDLLENILSEPYLHHQLP